MRCLASSSPKARGEDGGERGPPAQVEKGLGVPGGVLPAEGADHRLVAGGLHVPAEQAVGHPQHGVKPVDRQGQPGQDLGAVVPPAQVGLLVEEDVGPVGHIQPCGEVDPGPEEAADEGGGDLVGLVHPWLHPHRLGHLPPQPPVGEGSPQQADPAPGGPDPCDHGGPAGGGRGFLWGSVWNGCLLDWGLGCGLGLGGGVGQDGVPSVLRHRVGGENPLYIGPTGDPLGHQAHRQGQAGGQNHPQQHHPPQGAGDPPGDLFQGQAEDHHHKGHHRGGGGHGQ